MARDGAIEDMASLIKMNDIVNFRMHVHVGTVVWSSPPRSRPKQRHILVIRPELMLDNANILSVYDLYPVF